MDIYVDIYVQICGYMCTYIHICGYIYIYIVIFLFFVSCVVGLDLLTLSSHLFWN